MKGEIAGLRTKFAEELWIYDRLVRIDDSLRAQESVVAVAKPRAIRAPAISPN